MYGSWTWCHLKVTTWKPSLSWCSPPGSSSTPPTCGSWPSASSNASRSPQPGPSAPRCDIVPTAQCPVRTLMSCKSGCALQDALRGGRWTRQPAGRASGSAEARALWVRAAVRVPPARVAFNPAGPPPAPGRGLPAPAAHTRAQTPSRVLGTPTPGLTGPLASPSHVLNPLPPSPGALGCRAQAGRSMRSQGDGGPSPLGTERSAAEGWGSFRAWLSGGGRLVPQAPHGGIRSAPELPGAAHGNTGPKLLLLHKHRIWSCADPTRGTRTQKGGQAASLVLSSTAFRHRIQQLVRNQGDAESKSLPFSKHGPCTFCEGPLPLSPFPHLRAQGHCSDF